MKFFFLLQLLHVNLVATAQSGNQPLFGEKHDCFSGMVFDVGLPRTGTSSVATFGAKLGLYSTHLMDVPFSQVQACIGGQGCGFYKSWSRSQASSLLQARNGFMKKNRADVQQILADRSPSGGLIFEDLPTFGLACPLAKEFPNAKFVLTERNFESYYASVRYALCAWGKDTCEGKLSMAGAASSPDLYETSKLLYGQAFTAFCEQSSSRKGRAELCGQSNGRSEEAQAAWEKVGLSEEWRAVQQQHDANVRQCVPSDRLIELDMEDDDQTKAQRLFDFLGCHGTTPDFPHKNTTPDPQKQQPSSDDQNKEISSLAPPDPHKWNFLNSSVTQSMAEAVTSIESKAASDADEDDDDDVMWDALGKGHAWDSMTRMHPHWAQEPAKEK